MNPLKKLQLAAAILSVLLLIPLTVEVFGKLRPAIVRPLGAAMLVCLALKDGKRNP